MMYYLFDEAYMYYIDENGWVRRQEVKHPYQVFDEYGNYCFPNEMRLTTPNYITTGGQSC